MSAQRKVVEIYRNSGFTMSVCAPAEMTAEEVLAEVERQEPCGAFAGWHISTEEWLDGDPKMPTGKVGPIPCNDGPERTHWLITC